MAFVVAAEGKGSENGEGKGKGKGGKNANRRSVALSDRHNYGPNLILGLIPVVFSRYLCRLGRPPCLFCCVVLPLVGVWTFEIGLPVRLQGIMLSI